MNRFRRRLAYLLVAVSVVLGGVWLLRPEAAVVEIGRVVRGALEVTLDEEGQTRIHPRYVVAAPVAGRLAQLELDPGDSVAAGAVVAKLFPAPLDARARAEASGRVSSARAAERAAEADAAAAAAALAQARSTLERFRALFDAGQLAAADLDRAATEEKRLTRAAEGARERAIAARFEVATARSALLDADTGATILVRAPTAGRVLRLLEDSERVVPAGTPILELGNPANLEIVVEVLSTDAVGIAAGAAMTVDVGGGRRLAGQVREVEPAGFTKISPLGVEEQRVRVVGELDPGRAEGMPGEKGRQAFTAGLGDRFRVRGHIVLWRGDAVIQAPSGAVFRAGDGWAAYRIDAGRARLTRVEVGHRGADTVEVLSGLGVGDRLVLYPGARITDGARVRGLEHGAPGTPP